MVQRVRNCPDKAKIYIPPNIQTFPRKVPEPVFYLHDRFKSASACLFFRSFSLSAASLINMSLVIDCISNICGWGAQASFRSKMFSKSPRISPQRNRTFCYIYQNNPQSWGKSFMRKQILFLEMLFLVFWWQHYQIIDEWGSMHFEIIL